MLKEGIDIQKLQQDVNDPELYRQLVSDVKEADKLQITATPTIYIGTKQYKGMMPYPELKKALDSSWRNSKK